MFKYMNNMYTHIYTGGMFVAVFCIILQCVAVCCSALQCVAVCCSVLQCVAVCCSALQCVAVCCSVLQCAIPSSKVYTEDSNGKNGGEFRGGRRCAAFSASSGLCMYFNKNMVTFRFTHNFFSLILKNW